MWGVGGGGMLPDFLFCSLFPVQQTTSGTGLSQYIITTTMFDDVRQCFCFAVFWCPCMAINVSVQYDGGLLPDIILLTQCYYHT